MLAGRSFTGTYDAKIDFENERKIKMVVPPLRWLNGSNEEKRQGRGTHQHVLHDVVLLVHLAQCLLLGGMWDGE